MNPLFQAGLELQQFMREKEWPFCFIGGLAVIRWEEVRMTQDVDLSLLSGFGNEEIYIDALLSTFRSRISNAKDFALTNRVLLLLASNGVAVDISLAGLPFEQEMIERATSFCYSPDCSLITCPAEDLVILKAFADRIKDWADIEGILTRQGPSLDFKYIIGQLTLQEFLAGDYESYEFVEGKLIPMAAPKVIHGKTSTKMILRLGGYVEEHELGELYTNETVFQLGNRARKPDVAFVAED